MHAIFYGVFLQAELILGNNRIKPYGEILLQLQSNFLTFEGKYLIYFKNE